MSNFMINVSNLKIGGALQVADSFIRELRKFHHQFVVVISSSFEYFLKEDSINNIIFIKHDYNTNCFNFLSKNNKILDNIVKIHKINSVFTIFGPIAWKPKVKHISGFARPHIVYYNSYFIKKLPFYKRVNILLSNIVKLFLFYRNVDIIVTESNNVTDRLKKLLKNKKILTVTNTHHQIFDDESKWEKFILPFFDGFTILYIASNYLHKNIHFIPNVINVLIKKYPNLNFRFVLTIEEAEIMCDEKIKKYILFIGKQNINMCPSLYQQSDCVFIPTLLECFTASYPEAMKMERIIITTDLPFAHELCSNCAIYFPPDSAEKAAESIYSVLTNCEQKIFLFEEARKKLLQFDTAISRAEKYLKIMESSF